MALSTENKLYISLGVLAVLGGALFLQNKKEAAEAQSYTQSGQAAALPKIEIFRRETGKAPLYDSSSEQSKHYLAIATDDAAMEADVPVLLFSDAGWLTTLTDLVEREVMHR